MAQADIEIWADNVKDVIDDRDGLCPKEQIEALRELIRYIEVTSIPDVEALLKPAKRRARAKVGK